MEKTLFSEKFLEQNQQIFFLKKKQEFKVKPGLFGVCKQTNCQKFCGLRAFIFTAVSETEFVNSAGVEIKTTQTGFRLKVP